ncbi:MAG: RIP metalloprotease RseP [Sphingomonadales bacterium]|nr:RIP metalloprotease RseP [Sphingomonadales bacterium]
MALESPNIFITLFAFIILIGTLVIIHELGHYWVGRWFGVKAEKFSVGFGPQLWGRTDKRGTLWRIGALPLGGYVQFAGDMNPASQPSEEWLNLSEEERNQTFQSKTLWQRALIVFAGPAINFLFAILLLSGFLITYGQVTSPPIASMVQAGSAAEKAGIEVGDRIMSINGRNVDTFQELATEVSIYAKERVTLRIKRGSGISEKQVVLDELIEKDRFGNEYRRGLLGIQSMESEIRSVGIIEAPWLATKETANIVRLTVTSLGQIITGKRSVKELGGPAKIAKVAGEHFVLGLAAFIWLAAMISINLGFMNLLPIPMLDGGHLLLYGIEAVRRKPATPMVQEWAFRAGFLMLVGFMLVVTFNDLVSFGLFAG